MQLSSNRLTTTTKSPRTRTQRNHPKISFSEFVVHIIDYKLSLGKHGSAKNYRTTLKSLIRFNNGSQIMFANITPSFIEQYESWLRAEGIRSNSISFYIRNLRALYNMAVDRKIIRDTSPFRHAYTKIERTTKRAISINDIRRIKSLDLHSFPSLELTRDIFLFLFYCRGMSFIDATFLTDRNIHGNEILYYRHKTGQELRIGINGHISGLLSKWGTQPKMPTSRSPKLLIPILEFGDERSKTQNGDERSKAQNSWDSNSRKAYETSLRRINRNLKKIGQILNLDSKLTTYVSRHSWASIAKSKGIPTATISDALGHDSELTTQIYLDTIATDKINRANDIILNDL